MVTLQQLPQMLKLYGARPCVGVRQDLGVRWWTYERLDLGIRQAAAILRRAGVGKGDRVLIRGSNSPEWVAFFLGAVLRGAILVPLDHDSPSELVQRIAACTTPKVFLNSGEPVELAEISSLDLNSVYSELCSESFADLLIPVSLSDPVAFFYTSGTTASPRGVVLTHGNIASQVDGFRRWRWITRRIPVRIAVMAPMSHAQGIMLGMGIPLSLGLSTIYTCSSHAGYMLRLLRDNQVLILSTVPRVLRVLADLFRQQYYAKGPATLADKLENVRSFYVRRHYVFTHMRRVLGWRFWAVFVGGAPLPKEDEQFWKETGRFLIQGYGLTEASAMVTINTPWSGAFGSVGKPLAHQEVRIADDGEVLVRGPNVMSSYAGEDGPGAFSQGFLKTGDIGHIDRHNRLYITGRKKDVIVTGEGFNVHPSDIEAVLHGVSGVRDSLVVGVERDNQTQVHAILLLDDGANATDIVSQANRNLFGHQRIQSWTVWPDTDFPRSSLLKPRRKIIEDRLRLEPYLPSRNPPHNPRSGDQPGLPDLMNLPSKRQRLLSLAHYLTQARAISPGQSHLHLVRDLGLTSLDLVELGLLMEKQSGKVLDQVRMGGNTTLGDVQQLLTDSTQSHKVRKRDWRDPPRWSELSLLNYLRRFINPAVLYPWTHLVAKVRAVGQENLAGISRPVIFAVSGHDHGFDVLLIYAALPAYLRRHLAVVMSRMLFNTIFDEDATLVWRVAAILGLKLFVPVFFPSILSSHFEHTRDSLLEACRLVDRGYSLVSFGGEGVAVVAKQCGIPIVPVQLVGNHGISFKPRSPRFSVSVTFGQPMDATPNVREDELVKSLNDFFSRSNSASSTVPNTEKQGVV